MKILVVSDTHGARQELLLVLKKEKFDRLVFLGDYCSDLDSLNFEFKFPPAAVLGNRDLLHRKPKEIVTTFLNKKFLITHGHLFDVKQTLNNLISRAEDLKVDCVLFGHTHEQTNITENNILYVNPGAFGKNKESDYCYAILTIANNKIGVEFKTVY